MKQPFVYIITNDRNTTLYIVASLGNKAHRSCGYEVPNRVGNDVSLLSFKIGNSNKKHLLCTSAMEVNPMSVNHLLNQPNFQFFS